MNDDDAKWITIMLFLMEESTSKDITDDWLEFENNVKYHSRFFPKSGLLTRIKNLRNAADFRLNKGEKIYRARLFNNPFLGYYTSDKKEVMEIILKYFPELKDKKNSEEMYYYLLTDGLREFRTDFNNEILNYFRKKKRFWGYNAKDSDAPPVGTASSGRANAQGISFLYSSDNIKTAMAEVRPHSGQDVSVATIRINNALRLFDFSGHTKEDDLNDRFILSILCRLFSIPKNGDESSYYATQYIGEYIRELGYDGLRFKSSLVNGNNIVLFDTTSNSTKRNYTILSSKVYSVIGTDILYKQLAPQK